MGLVNKNYKIEETGLILPEAYAIVTRININGFRGNAIVSIQSSRENAELVRKGELKSLKDIPVVFDVNVDKNPYVIVYNTVNGSKKVNKPISYNPDGSVKESKEITVYGELYGWADDIV